MSPRLRPLRGVWATRIYRCRPLTMRSRPVLAKTVRARTSQISQGSDQGYRHSHRRVVLVWMAALWLTRHRHPGRCQLVLVWMVVLWLMRRHARRLPLRGDLLVHVSMAGCRPTARRLHHQQLQDHKSLSLRPRFRLPPSDLVRLPPVLVPRHPRRLGRASAVGLRGRRA